MIEALFHPIDRKLLHTIASWDRARHLGNLSRSESRSGHQWPRVVQQPLRRMSCQWQQHHCRGRTLKLTALKKNGLDDPDTIARVAREGIGQMSGYGDVLGVGGDELVAAWIWEQAQNAWIQG